MIIVSRHAQSLILFEYLKDLDSLIDSDNDEDEKQKKSTLSSKLERFTSSLYVSSFTKSFIQFFRIQSSSSTFFHELMKKQKKKTYRRHNYN